MTNTVTCDREKMIARITRAYKKHAAIFETTPWTADQLSESGWMNLVGVPWLLDQVKHHGERRHPDRHAEGDPRPHGVGLPKASLQFVHSQQSITDAPLVVPTGNPCAKFLVCLLAKLMRVSFVVHHAGGLHDPYDETKP